MDDLTTSLKATAGNKITSKNAWKSTLIEHFSDISIFEDRNGINFQKASAALDGCIKVYTTRVEDVAEGTSKLLGAFGQEKTVKKKTKKRAIFIEKDPSNINIKIRETPRFNDPIFSAVLYDPNIMFLTDVLKQQKAGILLYEDTNFYPEDIIINKEKDDIDMKVLPVSPGLKGVKESVYSIPYEQTHPEHHGEAPSTQQDLSLSDEGMDFGVAEATDNGASVCLPVKEAPVILEETPFGYFKGWAGPSSWKLQAAEGTKPANKGIQRKKEPFLMDFFDCTVSPSIFERSDVTMSKEHIVERRRCKNILPDDLHYGIADLYRFFLLDGAFRSRTGSEMIIPKETQARSDEPSGEEEGLEEYDVSMQLEHSLVLEPAQEAIKPIRSYTKIDIVRLKENIMGCIRQDKTKASEIFKDVRELYPQKEAQAISVHQCIVSLLYLANENGFELKPFGEDVIISTE